MPSTILEPAALKLSICVATYNRAAFIGMTLESILGQASNDCEVVVLDGASTDDTERVVLECGRRYHNLRYIRQNTNNGLDRDFDRVVELAHGEYCWLMADDDLLKPGAVAAVLHALRQDLSLIIVNEEARDFDMRKVLQPRVRKLESDRRYAPWELDRLFVDVNGALDCNCIVMKRAIWLERDREAHDGSHWIHMWVIFQKRLPGEALVMAEPLIMWRMSNAHTWSPRLAELLWVRWPAVVESMAVSDVTKKKLHAAEPWKSLQKLLIYRALGLYSLTEYRQWIRPRLCSMRERMLPSLIALVPGTLVNELLVLYYCVRQHRGIRLQLLRESRFRLRNWKVLKLENLVWSRPGSK